MRIAIPKERRPYERRVAATPDTVKQLVGLGADVVVETGAGAGANFGDADYQRAGAEIAPDETTALGEAEVVFKVQRPLTTEEGGPDELALMKDGAVLIAMLDPSKCADQAKRYAAKHITAFAMELMPRISRAQSMDVLSSQSNLTGYRAVLDGAHEFGRAFPMMMTAAGTSAPARVFVLGVGVAGLQAIATARRLGAIVIATDVRAATKEQVESLGAKFVQPKGEESGEGDGGYAKEMSAAYLARQAELVHETLKRQDVAICTALIPGRPAPTLITEDMVKDMKPGSVIVDLAVEQGGNCTLSKPGEVVDYHGVKIVGYNNVASRVAVDASALYAKNLLNFITPQIDKESKELALDWQDETVSGTALTRDGKVVHPLLCGKAYDVEI